MASCVVPTGQVLWHLGPTRTSEDCAAHLADVHRQRPAMAHYAWVVDNLQTHWSLEVCRLVATWCHRPCDPKTLRRGVQRRTFLSDPTHTPVCHFTPKQGSWLHQVALWLSVVARRFLKRGDFCSPEDFTTRLLDYLDVYNTHHAQPYRWTYTGRGNPWCGLPPSVTPGANSGRGGRGLVPGPTVLNVLCIPRAPISGLRLN